MRRLALGALVPLLAAACGSCKDPETAAFEARAQTVEDKLGEGHGALARGEYEKAARAYRTASAENRQDPIPLLYLADAYRQGGNDAAAELTYRQADDLAKVADGQVKRRMAELFVQTAQPQRAIRVYQDLMSGEGLGADELLALARLQAANRDRAVFRTLQRYRAERPEDLEADAVEADAYLNLGDELKAAQMMDELIRAAPELPAARLVRARFFLRNGYADLALQDLDQIGGGWAERAEVIDTRASVYVLQGRKGEAEALLEQLLEQQPRAVDALVRLAELKLDSGLPEQAEQLTERALLMQPRAPGALFLRARILELGGELEGALAAYRTVVRVDPGYAPAHARLARLHHARGEAREQLRALERLVALKQASVEDKAELAALYANDPKTLRKGWALIEEVLAAAPGDRRYLELRDRLKAGRPRPKRPLVIEVP